MSLQVESILDRADELLEELEDEYRRCLQAQNVSERAKNITHEVLEKLRNSLDHSMTIAWNKNIASNLSEQDKRRARVYFPIADNLDAFRSILGRGFMVDLDKVHRIIYDFLLKQQPFSSSENRWLQLLAELAAEGKHVQLAPQKRMEARRLKVTRSEGYVSWDPSSVKFGSGVSIMGAPVDPRTQRIIPTPGVTEQVEIWVSFIFEGRGVNSLIFCKEASQKTRKLVQEMLRIL